MPLACALLGSDSHCGVRPPLLQPILLPIPFPSIFLKHQPLPVHPYLPRFDNTLPLSHNPVLRHVLSHTPRQGSNIHMRLLLPWLHYSTQGPSHNPVLHHSLFHTDLRYCSARCCFPDQPQADNIPLLFHSPAPHPVQIGTYIRSSIEHRYSPDQLPFQNI